MNHTMLLRSAPHAGRRRMFWGVCECGWTSQRVPTAGMVHGAHGAHVALVEAEHDG